MASQSNVTGSMVVNNFVQAPIQQFNIWNNPLVTPFTINNSVSNFNFLYLILLIIIEF